MGRFLQDLLRQLETERLARNRAKEAALLRRIKAGPPDRRIPQSAWETWCRYKWVSCPQTGHNCSEKECRIGLHCRYRVQKGQFGNGEPVPKRDRVRCEATTRKGTPCAMPVVPGKIRCRLHGGLSTGPRTAEGRARIVAAQRARWQKAKKLPKPAIAAAPPPQSTSRRLRNWRRRRKISPMAV